jgi:putative hydrolase of the HAD superfamily
MSSVKYTHVFFDLDHTLWDFDTNTRLSFDEILQNHQLYGSEINDIDAFMDNYVVHNKNLWDLYKKGAIEKNFLSYHRFELTLRPFGIENIDLARQMASDYIRISPTKTSLMDGAIHVLEYLQSKYKLGLITNGFDEIQFVKLKHASLERFFPLIVTSEEAGYKKPDPGIFSYTLNKAGAEPENSIYIGDDAETDVLGAKSAGVDQVLVTFGKDLPDGGATFVISSLHDLKQIL